MPNRKQDNLSISLKTQSRVSVRKSRNQFFGVGFRTVVAILLLLPGLLFSATDQTIKMLTVLTSNFESSSPEVQTRVLREIGLLKTDSSIPFLATVAANENFGNDVRREALKAMLATDGIRYRPVLEPLKATEIETGSVTLAFLDIGDPRFAEVFVRKAAQKDIDARALRVAVVAVLDLWNGEKETKPPFELWKDGKASKQLTEVVSESAGTRKRRGVEALGWVRDRHTTQTLIRLLDDSDIATVGAAIEGLGNPGVDASSALGRFLMKSKSPELRRLAIQSLVKRKTASSKRALKVYRKKATAEERALLDPVLR